MSALRGDDLGLPRYNGDNYSKTWKPKGHRQGWTWESGKPARLLVLVLALAGLVFTFTSTRSGPSGKDNSQGPGAPSRHLQQQAGQVVPGSGRSSSSSKRQLGFNPLLHRMYSELPPLREASSSVITGSWQLNKAIYDYAAGHPAAEVLSWDKPRVVLFRSFLSPEEVQHLIAIATPHMQRSEVLKTVGADGTAVDDSRTSSGAWAPTDDVVKQINARIHRLVAVPEQFGEGLYVLRYQQRQQYLAHNDHCMPTGKGLPDAACAEFLTRAGGPECGRGGGGPTCGDRVLTFILSLKSPSQGGETVFPDAALTKKRLAAAGKQPEAITSSSGHAWYCQEPEVLGASLGTGDAIMFWDYVPGRGKGVGSYANETAQPQAQPILEALHSGCPVVEGEKWIATRWMRSTGMDYPYHQGRRRSEVHAQ